MESESDYEEEEVDFDDDEQNEIEGYDEEQIVKKINNEKENIEKRIIY